MRSLLDINVLIALLDSDHVSHHPAKIDAGNPMLLRTNVPGSGRWESGLDSSDGT